MYIRCAPGIPPRIRDSLLAKLQKVVFGNKLGFGIPFAGIRDSLEAEIRDSLCGIRDSLQKLGFQYFEEGFPFGIPLGIRDSLSTITFTSTDHPKLELTTQATPKP